MLKNRIRPISPADDAELARIIRTALVEFGADGPGFAWADPQLDRLYRTYESRESCYLVVVDASGRCLGGGGVAPFACDRNGVCEVQKMYLTPEARGQGLGRSLLNRLLAEARQRGYRECYLETFGPMHQAQALYDSLGFRRLSAPWGNSGHHACDTWMARSLLSP